MRRFMGITLTGLIVVMALVAAGCGGGGGAAKTAAVPTPTGTPSDPAAVSAFNALVKKFGEQTAFHVAYDMKSADPQSGSFSATLTFTKKGKSTRSEFDGTVNGGHSKFETLFDGDHLYICDDQAKACAEPPPGPSLVDPLAQYSPASLLQSVTSVDNITTHNAPSQQIAGVATKCFALHRGTDSNSTYCLDPATGLVLLVDGTSAAGKQTFMMRAKDVSAKVDSVDVTPPYKVATVAPTTATATATPKGTT